ncbi:MAG: HD domain-containing protein [Pseudomonadota bacterium]|nr:HD domain-containing protein [Pseudomonadota bacterium]
MTDHARYDAVWRRAEPYMRVRKNDVHIPLSFAWLNRLLAHYPDADRDICSLALILHDIGWYTIDTERMFEEGFRSENFLFSDVRYLHEAEGVRLATEVLKDTGWDALIDPVCEIIDGHDTRVTPHHLNDRIMRDADKLWRYDVPGVAVACDWFDETPHANLTRAEKMMDGIETDYGRSLAEATAKETRARLFMDML